jgi:hypothetical protein
VAPAEAAGDDAFTYAARDGKAISAPARAGVAIKAKPAGGVLGATQSAPTAATDEIRAAAGTDTVVATSTLLANDRDPDGDPLTVTAVSGAKRGTVGLEGTNVRFRPDAGFTGVARFSYEISDGRRASMRQLR